MRSIMFLIRVLILIQLFDKCTGLPQLCNGQNFDDHRYLYGQETVPCHVFRPGTCLVVSPNKTDISVAQMECTYRYGGQLVVPKDKDEVLAIRKKLYFHPNLPNDFETSRFFLGLIANNRDGDLRINVTKYSNTFEEHFWNRVMMSHTTSRIKSEDFPMSTDEKKLFSNDEVNQPTVGTCIDKVIGLVPESAKFKVLNGRDKHYYLCETPRWPKYKCPPGYLLDRSQPMCYKAFPGSWNFYGARLKCRDEKSVVGATRFADIGKFAYATFLTYLLNEDTSIPNGRFHVSMMNHNHQIFCDDGSECDRGCLGATPEQFSFLQVTKTGERDNPLQTNTACTTEDRTADEFGVVCSVRPDQSRAQT